ncbi:MAG: ferrous iron transport protein B [Gammaproteobacteria bacterium RIFCSPHIGHO2_12_FULL_37_14]|nr:MAG: ferrous iron transport protein B [Gammaproteobacteria bacterium RIFCSPHIGHO2_12_FULL_37_14]
MTSVALVGNPNCGKTTLFNALTGGRQRVGNWPGVTVERKTGSFTEAGKTIDVIDLPGIYSLVLAAETNAVDERIAYDFIVSQPADLIINIVDASNLDRHLYLTTQLLEMKIPILLVLNMMDVARAKQIHIDSEQLSQTLGCPVIAIEANKRDGVGELKRMLVEKTAHTSEPAYPIFTSYPDVLQTAVKKIIANIQHLPQQTDSNIIEPWFALRLLENDAYVQQRVSASVLAEVATQQAYIQHTLYEDADIIIADTRYRFIQQLLQTCISRSAHHQNTWTSYVDNVVLNRVFGIPIFLVVMYCLFFFSINIGGAFQDFFDIGSQTIFVDGLAYTLTHVGAPTWLTVLLANGIGRGINTTVTFIPVIGSMFLFLALLEDSGYMARAAFVVDRFMRAVGLPGKAFVPMIVGFGCNVPAVMAARTLENKRDRILTVMMSPFMSCGARLAIYAVFTAAFFPSGGQNIVFILYIIGIVMAIFTGFILRTSLLAGDPSPLVMELPPYHMPHLKTLCLHAWQRLQRFVFRAGRLIVPICILIGVLNSLSLNGSLITGNSDTTSLLSLVGQWVTPIFSPMGIRTTNWPATVGLVTGILAKEVVVGTLNTLYSQMGHFASSIDHFQFWGGLQDALYSIPRNLAQLMDAFSNPLLAQAPIQEVNQGVYGLMYQQFDGQVGAFAYLLFVLLYFPCISTTAAMLRELHRGWSIFSIFWMTGIAYGVAVVFYQAATWWRHPVSSSLWVITLISIFLGTIATIRWCAGWRSHEFA